MRCGHYETGTNWIRWAESGGPYLEKPIHQHCPKCNETDNKYKIVPLSAVEGRLEGIYIGYDIGLDAYVESKAHRAQLMKEKGVREAA